jgi:hypothetical protein
VLGICVEQFGAMAVGVERLDRGKAAGHRDSRRVRPRRPARDRPTDRLAQLVALRFVLHDATRPAQALGGVNTLGRPPRSVQGLQLHRQLSAD